jgi:hypothetical protein
VPELRCVWRRGRTLKRRISARRESRSVRESVLIDRIADSAVWDWLGGRDLDGSLASSPCSQRSRWPGSRCARRRSSATPACASVCGRHSPGLASCRTGGRAGAFNLSPAGSVAGGAVGGGSSTPVPPAHEHNRDPTSRSLRREPVKLEVEIHTSPSSAACRTTSRGRDDAGATNIAAAFRHIGGPEPGPATANLMTRSITPVPRTAQTR